MFLRGGVSRLDDRIMGTLVMIGSFIVLFFYGFFVFFSDFALLVVKLTAFLVVAAVLGVAGWIGYALATTPLSGPLVFSLEETEAEPEG